MYDYVLQYDFDKETQDYIQNIKNTLKSNNVVDRERNWLPHITFNGIIKYIWGYNQNMELLKEYILKDT